VQQGAKVSIIIGFKIGVLKKMTSNKDILVVNFNLSPKMMNCPTCGAIMIWLNGSVLHEPPVKQYECRRCQLFVVKYADGNYEMKSIEQE
jgi:transposase-like protein